MNVEELLKEKDISFTPKGRDFVVRCLNPDHEDRNPSMRVDQITGIFNCFACHFKGNLFTLFGEKTSQLQMRREIVKRKIVEKSAESIGLSFPRESVPYIGNWRDIKPATYKRFEAFQEHSSTYSGRIVFPVRDITGRIVAFNGRHTTGGTPKYIIQPPGAKLPLFPIVEPIRGSIILVEGIYDMINLHDKGLTNTVCCFGTSNINEDKLSMLSIQGVDRIDIFFDGDEAGQKGAKHIKDLCERIGIDSRNFYIKEKDPGDLTEKQVSKIRKKLYP